jgi:hypothetical protein
VPPEVPVAVFLRPASDLVSSKIRLAVVGSLCALVNDRLPVPDRHEKSQPEAERLTKHCSVFGMPELLPNGFASVDPVKESANTGTYSTAVDL